MLQCVSLLTSVLCLAFFIFNLHYASFSYNDHDYRMIHRIDYNTGKMMNQPIRKADSVRMEPTVLNAMQMPTLKVEQVPTLRAEQVPTLKAEQMPTLRAEQVPTLRADPMRQSPTTPIAPVKKGKKDFFSFCKSIAKNNTIMMTYTDEGYLPLFDVFYKTSHLERYSNFFVVAADATTYRVGLMLPFHA